MILNYISLIVKDIFVLKGLSRLNLTNNDILPNILFKSKIVN